MELHLKSLSIVDSIPVVHQLPVLGPHRVGTSDPPFHHNIGRGYVMHVVTDEGQVVYVTRNGELAVENNLRLNSLDVGLNKHSFSFSDGLDQIRIVIQPGLFWSWQLDWTTKFSVANSHRDWVEIFVNGCGTEADRGRLSLIDVCASIIEHRLISEGESTKVSLGFGHGAHKGGRLLCPRCVHPRLLRYCLGRCRICSRIIHYLAPFIFQLNMGVLIGDIFHDVLREDSRWWDGLVAVQHPGEAHVRTLCEPDVEPDCFILPCRQLCLIDPRNDISITWI